MKEFYVDLDVTFSTRMYVYAEDEESARSIAINKINDDPHYNTRNGCWVSTEVTDIFEE